MPAPIRLMVFEGYQPGYGAYNSYGIVTPEPAAQNDGDMAPGFGAADESTPTKLLLAVVGITAAYFVFKK